MNCFLEELLSAQCVYSEPLDRLGDLDTSPSREK